MEKQAKKTCPYCGEEIMATAKKCKHCGEWLIETTNTPIQQDQIETESEFNPEYLYNYTWLNILFWVTVVGAFIQAVHQSGLIVEGTRSSYLVFIQWAGAIPEVIGDILVCVGDIIFMVLLMNVFSHLHKPLKGWFLAIVFAAIIAFISLISNDSLNDEVALLYGVVGLTAITISLLLSIMIVRNYEGEIKTLGWVMIGYIIASMVARFVADYIISIAGFLLFFLIDFFYYRYLRDTLSKK
jgi:hypothetical protein